MPVKEDHKRFQSIIRGLIRQDFKKYISYDKLMGRQEDQFVKIPIPFIEIPRFRYGAPQESGVGQGSGEPDEGVEGPGNQPQAGQKEGEHTIEVEVSLDELADILGEELSLPRIQNRGDKNIEINNKKYTGRSSSGPDSLRHFKSSYKEALKRAMITGDYEDDVPLIIPLRKEDFRYRSFKETKVLQANAVVIYIMDVSGSMGEEQKEIVRLESFWINTWLKRNYKGLETRFIIHDAVAKEVNERTFFSTSESGGTLISSSYKLCRDIIFSDYSSNHWNIYPFHFSDGDNWSGEDTKICIQILKEFFLSRVNMFCYGQVESKYGSGQFLKDLQRQFLNEERILMSHIVSKDHILSSIKDFFGKGR